MFQFVGKRWRRLDVAHGMCAGYLVGCGWWGGWRLVGVLALVLGFWRGLGFEVGVSGGWGCLSGGSRFLGGGWCGVWGLFPLDPSLTPPPGRLVCCGSWFGPSRCWVVALFVGGCLVGCSSFLGGGLVLRVVCLAGCVLVGLFSTWRNGCCSRWLFRFGRVVVGGVPWWLAPWVVFVSGGCSLAGCVVPVGWADLDGRALRHPPFPPHCTRWSFLDPLIRWGNSHVKTLTD